MIINFNKIIAYFFQHVNIFVQYDRHLIIFFNTFKYKS